MCLGKLFTSCVSVCVYCPLQSRVKREPEDEGLHHVFLDLFETIQCKTPPLIEECSKAHAPGHSDDKCTKREDVGEGSKAG